MVQDNWQRTIEYVRLSLTEACNFCCPYCRPEAITPESQTNLLTPDEWLTVLGAFHQLGVRALRLTGGEPLLYPHLDELLQKLQERQWFEDVSMTTNGSLLGKRAKELQKLGLNRVNISLDAVDGDTFDIRTGRIGELSAVIEGIEAALAAGFTSVKINTVLMEPMSDDMVRSLLAYMEKWPVIWRFIEYMPFQGQTFRGPTFEEWQAQLTRICGGPLIPVEKNGAKKDAKKGAESGNGHALDADEVNADKVNADKPTAAKKSKSVTGFGPATYYALPQGPVVGFIFPMSHSYCHECNRVRLTSDGRLRLCLLRDDEADLVSLVRQGKSSEELAEHIKDVLQLRREQHEGPDMAAPKRAMWRIGG